MDKKHFVSCVGVSAHGRFAVSRPRPAPKTVANLRKKHDLRGSVDGKNAHSAVFSWLGGFFPCRGVLKSCFRRGQGDGAGSEEELAEMGGRGHAAREKRLREKAEKNSRNLFRFLA